MRDPNDTRDIGPRAGSPLWVHLISVTAVGVVAFAASMLHLSGLVRHDGQPGIFTHPLFWVLALLILVGEIWPIITPGRSGPESPVASVTFSFAVLIFWGLPVAVLLRATSTLVGGLAERKAWKRSAFNAAQVTLSLTVAGLVLLLLNVHATPWQPWDPDGRGLIKVAPAAVAYFVVNFLLVTAAIALHSRAPLVKTMRATLPYQAFVNLVLLATAPLVAIVMNTQSALLVLLFSFPLAAIYVNAAMSVQREHQAHHDELTGLSNRKLLIRRANDALAEAARSQATVGFLLLDLDRFKEVNDTLGHPVGDRLLRFVAQRLTRSVRPGDLVARLGGDEFAVLLPSVRDAAAAREVAARLRAAVAEPIPMDGMSFDIEASVGLALYPDDASGFEVLLQHADIAMYLAKERHTGVERYVSDADHNSPARLALLGDLRRGLDRSELEMHYQPKLYLDSGRPAGMEALVRWQHPVRGLMGPMEFIPLIEQSYLMHELTARVIDLALGQASLWWRAGMTVQVSLNVAARDLLDSGLPDLVERGLKRHGLPAAALLLEIDERVLTSEPAHAAATAEALAALGVSLSLDDFGTGYSSLVRLKRLPVAEVKIDSSFVGRLLRSPDDRVIVKSIVDLASALSIRSVAEGVESADVATALRAMGCVAAQGWHFSRPLNAASATAWLAERTSPAREPKATGAVGAAGAPGPATPAYPVGATGADP